MDNVSQQILCCTSAIASLSVYPRIVFSKPHATNSIRHAVCASSDCQQNELPKRNGIAEGSRLSSMQVALLQICTIHRLVRKRFSVGGPDRAFLNCGRGRNRWHAF